MCKVAIKNPEEKRGFIIFNHICSRDSATFTIPCLLEELKQYGSNISQERLQQEINQLITDGAVSQRVGHYRRMAMV